MALLDTTAADTSTSYAECAECAADLDHCHDVSIEHADGSTECIDSHCDADHWQHQWHLPCSAMIPPCPCSPEEHAGHQPWYVNDAVPEAA